MFCGGSEGRGGIGRLTAVFGALLLAAECSPEEAPPQLLPEQGAPPAAPAEAAPDSGPSGARRVASAEIVFEPSGTFPHGEHRRIECRTCHGAPPGHGSHGSVACTSCHGTPPDYATLPVRSQDECMACHHDPSRTGDCGACHSSPPPETLPVATSLRMSVWEGPRARIVSFEHGRHQSLTCRTCHEKAPSNAVVRGCESCHEDHHRPEASCGRCHAAEAVEHHDRSVHLGCGGEGCHQDPVVLALPPTRSVCLLCHRERLGHEPGGECVGCHLVNEGGVAASTESRP